MMGYQSFKELKVWQLAKGLAIDIYKLTNTEVFGRDRGLRDQMRRAAVSIAANIAEGYERNSSKDFTRFLLIAKGSLSELRTHLEIALEIGYLNNGTFPKIEDHCLHIGSMLTKLIRFRSPS
jgi:four helix bundle protein